MPELHPIETIKFMMKQQDTNDKTFVKIILLSDIEFPSAPWFL